MTSRSRRRTKINPALTEGEEPGLNRHWRTLFLDRLADTSNVTAAAKAAKINPSRAYKVRREEPEFAQAWLAALWEGYTHLEMEVVRRLRSGEIKTADGDKYDFGSAIRLLSAHRDNAARAQAMQRNVSAEDIRASIDRKVEAIRLRVMREKQEAKSKNDG